MTCEVRVFRRSDVTMSDYGDGTGSASIVRLVGPDASKTMGAYLACFDERSVPWTVRYDELIVCIEGVFRLRVGENVHELHPGDVIWIPDGTALAYEGLRAVVFIAMAPVDWRMRAIDGGAAG